MMNLTRLTALLWHAAVLGLVIDTRLKVTHWNNNQNASADVDEPGHDMRQRLARAEQQLERVLLEISELKRRGRSGNPHQNHTGAVGVRRLQRTGDASSTAPRQVHIYTRTMTHMSEQQAGSADAADGRSVPSGRS